MPSLVGKRLVTTALASVIAVGSTSVAAAPSASALQRCQGTAYAGRCVTTSTVVSKTAVVERVPLLNDSYRYSATLNCSFTDTISRSFTVGTTLTSSVKAEVFSVVEASVSGSQSWTISQTATRATSVAGSVTLPPRGRVECQRIYGYREVTTKVYEWGASGSTTKTFTSRLPYSLGARIVDI